MRDRLKRLFSFFHLLSLTISNSFCQRSYEKITRFHNEYQKFLERPTFSQKSKIQKFLAMKSQPFKKMKKLRFQAADFEKRKREKVEFSKFVKYRERYFDSERLWQSKLSLLKLQGVKLAISFQQFLQGSRSQIFVKKYEIMRSFNIRYENRWFFHKIFRKSRQRSSKGTNEK